MGVNGLGDVLTQDDLDSALDSELSTTRRLLPPSSHRGALLGNQADVALWAYGALAGQWHPSHERVVAVSKARHGVRPVAVWDLRSTLAYRALTARLSPRLPALERSGADWEVFKHAPLKKPGKYIVAADIAACYQMIDHGELGQELTVQTGDRQTTDHILGLLQAVSGRTYGIPQQSNPSDVLAEALLASLQRRVIRKGVDLLRYNDDFRINASTWSDVIRSIEILAEEARGMGFFLNDSKVVPYRRTTYKKRLEEAERLRTEIAEEAEIDLTHFLATYDGDVEISPPEAKDVEVLTAVRVLERWDRVAGKGQIAEGRRSEHVALLQLLPVALKALSATIEDAPGALDIAMRMLRYEQTMTPSVCEFLLTRADEGAVIKAFDSLLKSKAYLTGWQAWWLQQPLARLSGLLTGTGAHKRRDWIVSNFADARRSPVLRAASSVTMARHGLITVEELLVVYDRASLVERPMVVEAMALLKPPKPVRDAVTGDSKLHGWVYDWAILHA